MDYEYKYEGHQRIGGCNIQSLPKGRAWNGSQARYAAIWERRMYESLPVVAIEVMATYPAVTCQLIHDEIILDGTDQDQLEAAGDMVWAAMELIGKKVESEMLQM